MSLINEALKKAQKERALQEGKSRKSLLQESDPQGPRPGGSSRGNSGLPLVKLLFGLVIAGSTLASAIAFMIFLFIQVQDKPKPPAETETQPLLSSPTVSIQTGETESRPLPAKIVSETNPVQLSNQVASQNLENAPTLTANRLSSEAEKSIKPEADLQPAETSVPSTNLPESNPGTSPTPSTTVQTENSIPPETTLDPGLVGSSKNPTPPPPTPLPRDSLSPGELERVENYIRNASVTGIRLFGPDSKVVLNNRVYRIQELVLDFDLYLKIVGIQKRQILFEESPKPVRLSLKRTTPSEEKASSVEPPESDSSDSTSGEATPSEGSSEVKRPTRMRLNKKPTEEVPEESEAQTSQPETVESEPDLPESPFGDDDFDDFLGPEISEAEEEESSDPPSEEEASPPRRIQLRQKTEETSDTDPTEKIERNHTASHRDHLHFFER